LVEVGTLVQDQIDERPCPFQWIDFIVHESFSPAYLEHLHNDGTLFKGVGGIYSLDINTIRLYDQMYGMCDLEHMQTPGGFGFGSWSRVRQNQWQTSGKPVANKQIQWQTSGKQANPVAKTVAEEPFGRKYTWF